MTARKSAPAPAVVVAMSGGVDSSVVAALAVQRGCRVIGATLNLSEDETPPDPAAARIAARLGIEHHYLDRRRAFRDRVIVPAALEYAAGRTPNPCCECNFALKFTELLDFAAQTGAEKVLTGHYARLDTASGKPVLSRGADRRKDQSYFLYRLTPDQLHRIDFPLAELDKATVRRLAAAAGLECAERADSQDVCFAVPGENCGETLRRRAGLPARTGRFLHAGRVVGTHTGVHQFTIGQRQGLGVALGRPAYIAAIDPDSGDIELVTEPGPLFSRSFRITDQNWQGEPPEGGQYEVQVRYRSPAVPCRIEPGDGFSLIFPAVPLRAVTPGQAGVIYRGDRLIGGGVITGVEPCC